MISSRVLCICAVGFVLLPLLPATPPARAQSGNEITATYQVTEAATRSSQLQVTLHIRLSNHAGQRVSVTQVSLRCLVPCPSAASDSVPVLVLAHDSSETTRTFTISPEEYQRWQNGTRPRLLLKVLSDDGRELTRTITPTATEGPRKGAE